MLFDNSRSSGVESKNYLSKFIPILRKIFHKERKNKNAQRKMGRDLSDQVASQKDLIESEERLKEVLENQISCSYKRNLITDNYEYISPVFYKITGYTSEEMKNFSMKEAVDLIHAEDIPEIDRVMKESMNNKLKSSYYVEYRFRNKNGSYRWLHDQFTVLKNKEGVNVALIGSLSDIDERKQTEAKLHDTLLDLKKSQSIAHIGSWKLDLATNVFTSSEEALKLFGFEPNTNPTFKEVSDCIHPDDRIRAQETLKNSLSTNEPYTVEIRIITKDKRELKHILSWAEVQHDMDGKPISVIGTNQDITEPKRSEEILKQSGQRYKDLVENSGTSILIIDKDGLYLLANKKAAEQFGLPLDQIIGKSMFDLLPRDTAEKYLVSNRTFINSGGHREYEDTFFINGKSKTFLVVDHCLKDENGNNFALQSSSIDISARKEMEKELAEKEERLRAILENSRDAIGVHVNGIWEMCNSAAVQLFGMSSPKDLLGTSILNVIVPTERDRILSYVRKRMEESEAPKAYITRGLKSDGTEFDMEVTFSSYILDEVKYVLVILRDITERIMAEKSLRHSQIFLDSVIEKSPSSLWISDENGTLIRMNQACRDNLRLRDEEVVGKYNLFKDNVIEEQGLMPFVKNVFENGTVARFEITYDTSKVKNIELSQASKSILDVNISPIVDANGKVVNAIIQHNDITERKLAEEETKLSEKKFRSIIESSPIAYALNDDNGNITYLNSAFTNTFGYSSDDLKTIHDWWPRAYPDLEYRDYVIKTWQDHLEKAKQEGSSFEPMEVLIHCKDKSVRTVIASAASIMDQFAGIHLVILYDITERKNAEEFLRNTKWRLEGIIEGTHVGTWEWNVQTGETTFNEMWAQIIGYTISELEPVSIKTWERFAHPDDLKKSGELLERHFSGELPYYEFESRMKHKDGRWVWVHDRGRIITRTIDGKPVMMFGTHTDITERVAALEALQESEYKYHQLFENMLEGFSLHEIITDELGQCVDFRFIDCNSAYEKHTGLKREDTIGRTILEIMPNADMIRIKQYGNVVATGEPLYYEYYSQAFKRHLSVHVFKHSHGKFAAIFEDITERKEIQLALQNNLEKKHELNEMKNRFISMVSHELRTPLTSILASSDFLEMGGENYDAEKKGKQFARIRRSVDYMIDMLNEVLMINKMDRAKIDIILEKTNLSEFCRDLFAEVNQLYPKIKSKIEINLKDRTYNIDTILMKNILGNLISNAFKYNVEKGNVKFLVEDKSDSLIFKIADTGVGIPFDEQNKLFEPFSRMSNVKHIKGTGLGMSIIKNSIDLLNGDISFVSNENEGTEFTVKIPLID